MAVSGGWEFRRWLVDRLVGTEHATRRIEDDKLDDYAARIGVQPDVLIEARIKARHLVVEGKSRHALSDETRPGYRTYFVKVRMPPRVLKRWQEECERRDVESSVLLVSLLHNYLSGRREPVQQFLDRKWWHLDGRRLLVAKISEIGATALVSRGAWRALKIRATRLGEFRATVIRALMLEAMNGMHMDLPIVYLHAMLDDEHRYYLGPDLGA